MDTSENVLLTGGTGFIGAYLARELLAAGHEVTVFDTRRRSPALERLGLVDSVTAIRGDVTDYAALTRAVRDSGATRIAHLAARLSADVAADELTATRVNAVGANHVLEAARLFSDQVERVVLTSSETVYGPESAYDAPVEEDALLRPDSTYSAAKRHAECLAESYRENHGVPVVTLRPTGVFGPYQESFTTYRDLFEKPVRGESVAVDGGETTMSWLYVADAASAFARALLAPAESLDHSLYNVRGEVATVARAANVVRDVVEGAEVDVVDDADYDWSAQSLSLARASADVDYAVTYGLREIVEEYATVLG